MENIKRINEINAKEKEEKFGIIKKYPFNGRSIYLIDKFYILGYEPNEMIKILLSNKENKKALMNIKKKIKSEDFNNLAKTQKSFKNKISINEMPSLLNEISNDYKKKMPDIDLITNMLFPNKINIFIKAKYNKFGLQGRNVTHDNLVLNKNKSSPFNLEEETDIIIGRYGRESVSMNFNNKENDEEEDDLRLMKSEQYNMIFSYNPQEGSNSKKSINGFAYVFYKKHLSTW